MSATFQTRVRPHLDCNCGHPLSTVIIAIEIPDRDADFMLPMAVLVRCPRCQLTKPMPVSGADWKRNP